MKQSWIPAEWANSGTNTSTHHKLSPFHNKQFTSTGLSMDAKNRIKILIETNGGKYHANFPTATLTPKHKISKENTILCLTPDCQSAFSRQRRASPYHFLNTKSI